MAQGTLTLTNNSADVTGQGTAFLTDLKEGDFLLVSIAGLSYFLNVKAITSDAAITLTAPYIGETASSVGFDVIPKESLVNVPSGLIYESSRALRAQNLDKENWQKVFSVDDDITVTLIDGSQYTGISWLKASKGINAADIEAITAIANQISEDSTAADKSASAAAASSSAAQTAQSAAELANSTAQTAQASASNSAQSASHSADTATAQATEAGSQADLAKQYADSLNSDLLMAKANNLSDVTDPAEARENLSLDKVVQTSASTNLNYPTKNAALVLRDSDLTWGVYNNDAAAWSPLGIGQGGIGATNADAGLKNLSGFYYRAGTGLTENLNSLTGSKAGLYYCPANSQATTALNYPIASAGTLLVMKTGANSAEGCLQYYYPYNGLSPYFRKYDGTWGNWGQLVQSGDYGIGGNGTFTPTGIYNGFISESDGNTSWGAVNGGGWQANYANSRLFQMMISTGNDTYTRYVDSGDPKASKTDYPWTRLLKQGAYGVGIDLALDANLQVNLNTLGTSVSGFYYTTNESTLGGVTSDATYVLVNRGARPTCTAYKYVQNRSWDGFYMGTSGWNWREKPYLDSANPQTWTGYNDFHGETLFTGYVTNTAANPFAIRSANPTMSFVESDSSNSAYMFVGDGGNFRLNRDNTGGVSIFEYKRSANSLTFGVSSAGFAGTLQAASYSNTSDQRAKYNTALVTDALSKIVTLTGITFNMRTGAETEITAAGVFAQDIEKILPEAIGQCVAYDKDGNEIPDALSVDYSALSALYVEAFKEVNNIITAQQSQIDELKALVAQLIDSSENQVAGS